MLNYGPSDNQKFAIEIKPENFELIIFMYQGIPEYWREELKNRIGMFFTYTISHRGQQSIANRKFETKEEIKAPWNKLNPKDRKIAYVTTSA